MTRLKNEGCFVNCELTIGQLFPGHWKSINLVNVSRQFLINWVIMHQWQRVSPLVALRASKARGGNELSLCIYPIYHDVRQ